MVSKVGNSSAFFFQPVGQRVPTDTKDAAHAALRATLLHGGQCALLELVGVCSCARIEAERLVTVGALVALVAAPVPASLDDVPASSVSAADRDGAGERDHASRLPPKRRGSHYPWSS